MCIISDKIKLCTCIDENIDIESLNHYWVLHRYNKNKNLNILGEVMFPNHLHPRFEINVEILLSSLNTPEAFDKNLDVKNGDRLEVILCNNSNETVQTLYFNFEYTADVWKPFESDSFELMNNYDVTNSGEIKEMT